MTKRRVYLDWNATAPLRSEARAACQAALALCGNPSSVHAEGRAVRALVETARQQVAAAVGANSRQVIFTAGGTEANATALAPGLTRASGEPLRRLIVSAIEHPSVLAGGRFAGEAMIRAPIDSHSVLDVRGLCALLANGGPALVSVMLANNETGAIQPIADIAEIVHDAGGALHVDAVQGLGKVSIDINDLQCDLLTLSAHKIGGPQGVGALVVSELIARIEPLTRGGGQELRRRAGTENVAGIAGFGAAAEAAVSALQGDLRRMTALRDQLEDGLRAIGEPILFASNAPRLPNTTLIALPGLKAEIAVIALDLDGIAVSSGAACSSGKVEPSHVLRAMGVSPELAHSAIRFSLGRDTSAEDIDHCLKAWKKLADALGKQGAEPMLERF